MPKKKLNTAAHRLFFSKLPLANGLQKLLFGVLISVCFLLGGLVAFRAWEYTNQARFLKATNIVRDPVNLPSPPSELAQLAPAGAFVRSVEPIPGVSDRSIIIYITDFVFSSPLDSPTPDDIRCVEAGKYITGSYHLAVTDGSKLLSDTQLPEPIAGDYLNYRKDSPLVLLPLLKFSDITGVHQGQDFAIELVTHGCLNAGTVVGYYSQDSIKIIPFFDEGQKAPHYSTWFDFEAFLGAKGTVDFTVQPRGGGKSSDYRYVFNKEKDIFEDKTWKPEVEKEIVTQIENFEVPPDLGFAYPNGGDIQTVWQFIDPSVTVFTSLRTAQSAYVYAHTGQNMQQLLAVTNAAAITQVAITPDKKTLLLLESGKTGMVTHAYRLPALTAIPLENGLDLTADNFFEWPLQTGNNGCVISVKQDNSAQTVVRLAKPKISGGYEWYPLKDSLITQTSVTKKIEQRAVNWWDEGSCQAQLFVGTKEVLFPKFSNMSEDYTTYGFYFSYINGLNSADGFNSGATVSRHLVAPTVIYKAD